MRFDPGNQSGASGGPVRASERYGRHGRAKPGVEHPVLDVIRSRWSPAVYSPQTVEPEKLLGVLEAARWAPSRYNGATLEISRTGIQPL